MAQRRLVVLPAGSHTQPSLGGGGQQLSFFKLPHPRSNEGALYALDRTSGKILEARAISGAKDEVATRSCFVGESVVADGRLVLFTAIDPLFILLPILEHVTASGAGQNQTSAKMLALEDILDNYASDETICTRVGLDSETLVSLLIPLASLAAVVKRVEAMCEGTTVMKDFRVYRLDRSKVNSLLKEKVNRATAKAREQPWMMQAFQTRLEEVQIVQKELGKVANSAQLEEELMRWECSHMIAPLLSAANAEQMTRLENFPLLKELNNLVLMTPLATMPAFDPLQYNAKYLASQGSVESMEANKKRKVAAATAQKKALANGKGMKSINSFFTKK